MNSYEVDGTISIKIPDIRYNEMKYDMFKAREVRVDGEYIGEYHLSFNNIKDSNVIDIVKECTNSDDCEVLDPENYLKLEYGTYFKVSPESVEAMAIDGVMQDIDNKIKERFGN